MTGIRNWKDPSIRYDQTLNSVEAILQARLGGATGWLESCGSSSFCTLMEGLGALRSDHYFRFPNGDTIQMDDAVMCWMNDPKRGTPEIMENRRGDTYIAAAGLFGVTARYIMAPLFAEIVDELAVGNGVQLNLRDPGHWIAIVAADDDNLIFMDSWGNRKGLVNHGVHEKLSRDEFLTNVKPFAIVYEAI